MQSVWASSKQQVIQAQQQLCSWPEPSRTARAAAAAGGATSTSQEAARASHLGGVRIWSAEVRRAAAPWLQLTGGRAARASMRSEIAGRLSRSLIDRGNRLEHVRTAGRHNPVLRPMLCCLEWQALEGFPLQARHQHLISSPVNHPSATPAAPTCCSRLQRPCSHRSNPDCQCSALPSFDIDRAARRAQQRSPASRSPPSWPAMGRRLAPVIQPTY